MMCSYFYGWTVDQVLDLDLDQYRNAQAQMSHVHKAFNPEPPMTPGRMR